MKFGLLGTGFWAAQTHAAALARHPDAEFAGVWGRDPAKAAALATSYHVRAYHDVDALIADVDAVAVALPPGVQAELAVRAAEAGRHLLLDKPLALTVRDADRVVAAVDRTSVASLVFFTNRFYGNVREFVDAAAAGGPWHGARVTMFGAIFQPGNPYGGSQWRRDHGGLWDVGPHALSVLVPVLGPVVRVAAMGGPRATVHLLTGHASGATSTLSLTVDAPPAASGFALSFHGDPGIATMPAPADTDVDAFAAAITRLVANVRAGTPHDPCDVRFGRDVVAVLAAAETARRDGVTVPV